MIDCVLIRWNEPEKQTFVILNYNAKIESANVVGLDPDLEYLIKRTPYPIPDYDLRLAVLQTSQNFKG